MPLPFFYVVLKGLEQLELSGAATALARKSAFLWLVVYQREVDLFFAVMLLLLKIQNHWEAVYAIFSRILQLYFVSWWMLSRNF